MKNAIDTIERAANDAKAVRRALKRDLTRPNRVGKTPKQKRDTTPNARPLGSGKTQGGNEGLNPET